MSQKGMLALKCIARCIKQEHDKTNSRCALACAALIVACALR
jgi:hypothetical protein